MKRNELDQKDTQELTKEVDWAKDEDAQSWIDISIQNNCLKIVDVAELCSKQDPKKRTPETWRQYYYDKKALGFDTHWKERFGNEYKSRVRAKVYSRLDHLIDKEKRIDQVVRAGEFVEGKQNDLNIPIQVNNYITKEKDEFGI